MYEVYLEGCSTPIGSGSLDECCDFVQFKAFRGVTGYYVIDAETGEVVM